MMYHSLYRYVMIYRQQSKGGETVADAFCVSGRSLSTQSTDAVLINWP